MRVAFTLVAVAAAFPAVLANYWDGTSCTYRGSDQKTICDDGNTAILYCNADGHWRNGYTCSSGCCRITPPPFHGQAGNAYCNC